MDRVSRVIIKSLPMNIVMTLLIGITFRNIPAAMLGMIIAYAIYFILGNFIEWKYPR